MKKYKVIISILLLAGIIGGCGIASPEEGSLAECLPVTADEVDCYRYFSGSSSVSTEYGIYQYEDSFIFIAEYFNCGRAYMETFALTKEQQEAFIDEINQCSDVRAEISDTDGGHSQYGDLSVNGKFYETGSVNLDKLGIALAEDPVMIEEIPEELAAYEEADLPRMMALGKNNNSFMKLDGLGEPAFVYMLQEQIQEEISDTVTKVTVIEEREQDFVMELETEAQEIYRVTVTYLGYVGDIQIKE